MHTETEQAIKNFLLNKTITGIEFYIINETFYVFDEEHVWVIDGGGAELSFGDEIFTFGWNAEKEVYVHYFGKMTDLYSEVEMADLDEANPAGTKSLISSRITDVKMQWNWYCDLDENFEPLPQKNHMPVEMILTFENGHVLQLAAVDYGIDVINKKLKNIVFDSERSLLVTFNEMLEISDENLEKEIEESI